MVELGAYALCVLDKEIIVSLGQKDVLVQTRKVERLSYEILPGRSPIQMSGQRHSNVSQQRLKGYLSFHLEVAGRLDKRRAQVTSVHRPRGLEMRRWTPAKTAAHQLYLDLHHDLTMPL